MKTLKDLFLDELADMYDAERRITKSLPKMAKAATCPDLRKAVEFHLKETEGHIKKLEQVFKSFGMKAKGKTCEATVGLLEEGDQIAREFKGSPAINAALISVAQKVEHYEIASYGCLHEWSELLGNKAAASLLKQILDQEKGANESLNELAHSSVNREALGEPDQNESRDESVAERPANPRRVIRPSSPSRTRAESMIL
jgi:ferritin-like metal-binding protein YciE